MPNVQPDQHCKGSSNAPTWHAIAAFNWADAVPSLVAAGIPVAAADCALVTVDQPFDLTLQPSWKLERLESPLHTCALSLAATLGHVDTLAAMLVAGADPNPVEPHGRWMWHPLAAAAMSSRRTWSQALQEVVTVPEASALEMCRQLLAAGADILVACGAGYMPEHVGQPGPNWPLWLHSQPIQRLLLSELVQRCNSAPEPFQPSFRLCHDFLLLAAQLDDTAAYNAVASRVPAGRAPAEYAALATQLVDGARSGRGQRLMLRHMAQQAAAVAAAAAEPAGLAAHIGAALEHTLQGAAKHGELWEVSMLMDAGVRVSMAAINAAVAACRPEALALLLPQLRPAARLAVEHKAGGSKAWTVPSRGPQSYACPLLTLLGCRADEDGEAFPLVGSLQIAELLVADGFQPAVYRGVRVRREGDEQARTMPLFDPLLHDLTLHALAHGSGREVHLAITHPTWSRHQHHRFPPAFRAAARTLLLATQRASNAVAAGDNSSTVRSECGGSVMCEELGRLPEGVLGHVLQLAAYPLSVWAGADASHNP